MKKVFSLAAFLFLTLLAQAQTEKDNLLIGGDFDMDFVWIKNNPNNVFSFNLNTICGYFIKDNLAVGGGLQYNIAVFTELETSNTAVTIYPLLRYYFNSDNPIKFFCDVRPGLTALSRNSPGGAASEWHFIFRGGLGMAAFISDDVSVDFSLNYYKDPPLTSIQTLNRIGLNVGLQVFLNQGSKNG